MTQETPTANSILFPNGLPSGSQFRSRSKKESASKATTPKPLPLNQNPTLDWFWGDGSSMAKTRQSLELAARTKLSALIVGETGSGKELLARMLHEKHKALHGLSESEAPFIAVNCAAVPEALSESILFGHERGAFTSARDRKYGKFESAGKGTLFLDEIQNLNLGIQAKLLRVLQNHEIETLGARKPKKIECRLVAATNVPLEILVEKKLFRRDLYYRLNICPIYIPALRQRESDLEKLIEGLQSKISTDHNIGPLRISKKCLNSLKNYSWPGNLRELENSLLYATLRSHEELSLEALPPKITGELEEYLKAGTWI